MKVTKKIKLHIDRNLLNYNKYSYVQYIMTEKL